MKEVWTSGHREMWKEEDEKEGNQVKAKVLLVGSACLELGKLSRKEMHLRIMLIYDVKSYRFRRQ